MLSVALIVFLFCGIALFVKTCRGKRVAWTYSTAAGIRVPNYPIQGIDVSKFQGEINWKAVKDFQFGDNSRIHFAFVKATEGVSIRDPNCQNNLSAARRAGLKVSAYHFFIPWRDPTEQANAFVQAVRLRSGDLPPVLDIEANALRPDSEIIRDIDTWLGLVEKHYGIRPIIYTNKRFYLKFVLGHFDDYPLWLADYSSQELPIKPKNLLFWQYSEQGKIKGIKGKTDYNVFLGDEDKLAEICVP